MRLLACEEAVAISVNKKSLEIEHVKSVKTPIGDVPANESEWNYGFAENPSAEEYARRQGVHPVNNIASLYGSGLQEDWEAFDEALEFWRRGPALI